MIAFLQGIGAPELIIILVILLLLFGARKLPEMARSMGRASKEFKQGLRDGADEEPMGAKDLEHPAKDRRTD
ncbi:MAG TPA: twin-arginine translocase TatA/TatE family subunit [Actinomycetota bacterium]|nr:twin-arginine translocase TatA/TatE family subunit [Actinomycetota bacterium]